MALSDKFHGSGRPKTRRLSLMFGKMFKTNSTLKRSASDTEIEMPDLNSFEKVNEKSFNQASEDISQGIRHAIEYSSDENSLSDEMKDENKENEPDEMEGHTNSEFIFDTQCHIGGLKPEVVLKFPHGTKSGYLGDASDIKHIGDGTSLVVDMINNRVINVNKHAKSTVTYRTDDMLEPWASDITNDDRIYVTSKKNKCVISFSKSGEIHSPIKNVNFIAPSGIVIDKCSRLFISDVSSHLVTVHEIDGTFITSLGDSMSPIQHFKQPRYVTLSPNDDLIVSDSGNHSVKVFDSDGNFVQKIGRLGRGEDQLKCPYGVCTDLFGNILVADHYNDRVSYFSKSGQFIRHLVTAIDGVFHPQGLSITSNFKMFVTHGSLKANEVLVFDLRNNRMESSSRENVLYV